MKVIFVGAGPGDPELLTLKAKRMVETAQICIYAGSLIYPGILDLLPKDAKKYNSAKMNLDEIIEVCKDAKFKEVDVIRLHSGDPGIYGAILEQMNKLDEIDIEYEVIPGVSSFQAAAAALKTELTAPEVTQTIVLTRIKGRTPMPAYQELSRLAESRSTLCLFLSVHKLEEIAKELEKFYGKECPVAVVYKASWPEEKIIKGTLEKIAEKTKANNITKTAMVIVSPALARINNSSKLYDPRFSHEFRQGLELEENKKK